MSKVEAARTYLISTQLGTMGVKTVLMSDYDVEDIIHTRAVSQARALQFVNIGKQIDGNSQLPQESLPSIFRDNEETLVED